jgi:hypothetical protein
MINKQSKIGQATVEYVIVIGGLAAMLVYLAYYKDGSGKNVLIEAMNGFFNDIVTMQNLPVPWFLF